MTLQEFTKTAVSVGRLGELIGGGQASRILTGKKFNKLREHVFKIRKLLKSRLKGFTGSPSLKKGIELVEGIERGSASAVKKHPAGLEAAIRAHKVEGLV